MSIMTKINESIILIFLVGFLTFLQGCATEQVPLKIEKSLPQSKRSYYNDSFDRLREDLWDKGTFTYNKEQDANFELSDMAIENGKLKIETKTWSFSGNGLGSRYVFRGDFDIQVDCDFDFLEGKVEMVQRVVFAVFEKNMKLVDSYRAAIHLLKKFNAPNGYLVSYYFENGRFRRGKRFRVTGFHGTLRFIRVKSRISTFYNLDGLEEWKKLNTFNCTSNDLMLGLGVQNFDFNTTSIHAESSINAEFDNFRVNAAEKIIEDEI